MDNSVRTQRELDLARDEATKLLFRLYGLDDSAPCAVAWAECMECDKLSPALWIVGDFLLCHSCTCRRAAIARRADMADY